MKEIFRLNLLEDMNLLKMNCHQRNLAIIELYQYSLEYFLEKADKISLYLLYKQDLFQIFVCFLSAN